MPELILSLAHVLEMVNLDQAWNLCCVDGGVILSIMDCLLVDCYMRKENLESTQIGFIEIHIVSDFSALCGC